MTHIKTDNEMLEIDKKLANDVGLNNAIFIETIRDLSRGQWIRISYPELNEVLPFWSEPTLMRRVKFAEENGYVEIEKAGKEEMNRSNSYRAI